MEFSVGDRVRVVRSIEQYPDRPGEIVLEKGTPGTVVKVFRSAITDQLLERYPYDVQFRGKQGSIPVSPDEIELIPERSAIWEWFRRALHV